MKIIIKKLITLANLILAKQPIKPWDSKFISDKLARRQGNIIFVHVPFSELLPKDKNKIRKLYANDTAEDKYEIIDEHFYYPVNKNGKLVTTKKDIKEYPRVLAIPPKLLNNDAYMTSLGYAINPDYEDLKSLLLSHKKRI